MKDEKILDRAVKRFKTLHEAEFNIKKSFVEDMEFTYNVGSGQWGDGVKEDREKKGRPALTMNKLKKFVALVVNAEKGMPNTDDIIPVDDKGDVEVAKLYNEIINHIEYQSESEDIYNLAGEHAVAGGFGYWRILTEYCDEGFDQEIKIKPIKNPLMVSVDPKGSYAFIREAMTKDDFEQKYPKHEPVNFESYSGFDGYELWFEQDKVMVAEYFEKVPVEKTIVEVVNPVNGETAVIEQTKENADWIATQQIMRTRKADSYKIMWYKISGSTIIDRAEWPGKEIPIVEVVGQEVYLEGKTYKQSLIVDAKDGQKAYNYWLTANVEKVALTPKSPFVLTKEQISGYDDMWQEANIENRPYLLYNATSAGPPSRTPPPIIDQGAMAMLNIADRDIKDILGMYESSLGQQSNERSGRAILARAARSEMGTYSFQDNLRKAKIKTKKILIDLIPKIYDNERVIRLRGEDRNIQINWVDINGNKINDLSRGKYDIRTRSAGSPSRRQQTVENVIQAMQYAPDFAGFLLPLAMKYLDVPGSEEIAMAITQAQGQLGQGHER